VTRLTHEPVQKGSHAASGDRKAAQRQARKPAAVAAGNRAPAAFQRAPAAATGAHAVAVAAAPARANAVPRSEPAAGADEPITAPPPAAVSHPGNSETPVAVRAEPQVATGGTGTPEITGQPASPPSEPTTAEPVATAAPSSATPAPPLAQPAPASAQPREVIPSPEPLSRP
jgi:hypothetical protein